MHRASKCAGRNPNTLSLSPMCYLGVFMWVRFCVLWVGTNYLNRMKKHSYSFHLLLREDYAQEANGADYLGAKRGQVPQKIDSYRACRGNYLFDLIRWVCGGVGRGCGSWFYPICQKSASSINRTIDLSVDRSQIELSSFMCVASASDLCRASSD